MRFVLVSEHEEFTEKLKKTIGQEHYLGTFLTPEMINKTEADFDCLVCDQRFYSNLRSKFQIPIFLLSSTNASTNWVELLDQGADGVLFSDLPTEALVAQMMAANRRWKQKGSTQRFLAKFGLLIDLDRYRVELNKHVLDLTLTELKVLKELANEDDRVIPRNAIQQQVFGQLSPGNRSLDVHVCSLRKKLRPHGLDVESVRGVGYRLMPYTSRQALKTVPN